jgi:hypothetical protein
MMAGLDEGIDDVGSHKRVCASEKRRWHIGWMWSVCVKGQVFVQVVVASVI